QTKAEVVDLKEKLKRLKKVTASDREVAALTSEINEKEKAARELEAQAAVQRRFLCPIDDNQPDRRAGQASNLNL
ncbi:MAG: hypothetical protein OEU94_15355, partial [Aquincola sp.]|nr:hypothetical protein [Aquincola sp.]